MMETYWSKLGTENDTYMMTDTNSFAWATGGLNMTARDAAKFGQLIVNKGELHGERIFSEETYKRISTGDVSKFAKGSHAENLPGGAYSSYFWLTNNDDNAMMAKGMYSQFIYMNPEKDIVVVRLASAEFPSSAQYDLEMQEVFKAISDNLS